MDATTSHPGQPTQIRAWQNAAAFLFACALLFARRPDALLHAQFRAEDGHVWFADAYNLGWWTALFQTHTGYFQTLPRLAASLALLVPLALAPLVTNLVAIGVQALPVNLLLSARSRAWGNLRFRLLLAGVYLLLPNCAELSFGITESQWLLALSAFLVVVANTPRSRAGRVFDLILLTLCGLTGPFCVLFTPIALLLAFTERNRWRWTQGALLAACSLVQAWAMLIVDPGGRAHLPLGASSAMLARILGGPIYSATLLGANKLAVIPGQGAFLYLVCMAVAGTAILAYCSMRSPLPLRFLILVSAVLLALALKSPIGPVPVGKTCWETLVVAPGARYWFFPALAFAWSLLWCLFCRSSLLKVIAAYLLFFMCIGIVRDFRHPAFQNMCFTEYAKRFEAAPAGTEVTIPLNPEGWSMLLVKHPPE
jgi:hypothetical protein